MKISRLRPPTHHGQTGNSSDSGRDPATTESGSDAPLSFQFTTFAFVSGNSNVTVSPTLTARLTLPAY